MDLSEQRVLKNFGALALMKGMGYAIPLLTFPYVVRVIGVENYGLLAFAMAVTAYFTVLTDYGFQLSATREIAAAKGCLEKQRDVFSAVLILKILLTVVSFLLLLPLLLLFQRFQEQAPLFIITFSIVPAGALAPIWFFQGIEKMGYLTVTDLIGHSLYAALILTLVKSPEDYLLVPGLRAFTLFISSLVAVLLARWHFGITFVIPSRVLLQSQLKSGWHIFLSRVSLSLYTTTNTVLIGFMTSASVVGQYAIAEKAISALKSFFDAANQAIYPHLVVQYEQSRQAFVLKARRFTRFLMVSSLIVALLFYFLSGMIVSLIVGYEDQTIVKLFGILLIAFTISPLGGLFTHVLIIQGKTRQLQNIMFFVAVVNLFLAIPSILYFGSEGLALTTCLVQGLVIALYFISWRRE